MNYILEKGERKKREREKKQGNTLSHSLSRIINLFSKIEVNRHFLELSRNRDFFLIMLSIVISSFSILSTNKLQNILYNIVYSLILNDDWWFYNTLRGFIERFVLLQLRDASIKFITIIHVRTTLKKKKKKKALC